MVEYVVDSAVGFGGEVGVDQLQQQIPAAVQELLHHRLVECEVHLHQSGYSQCYCCEGLSLIFVTVISHFLLGSHTSSTSQIESFAGPSRHQVENSMKIKFFVCSNLNLTPAVLTSCFYFWFAQCHNLWNQVCVVFFVKPVHISRLRNLSTGPCLLISKSTDSNLTQGLQVCGVILRLSTKNG